MQQEINNTINDRTITWKEIPMLSTKSSTQCRDHRWLSSPSFAKNTIHKKKFGYNLD